MLGGSQGTLHPRPAQGHDCFGIRGEVSRGEKMTLRGTDTESYITEYTSVYEDYKEGFEVKASGCRV